MTNRELMALVRAWVAESYPGCELKYIQIHCRHLSKSIRLVDWPFGAEPAAPPSASAQTEQRGDGLSPCVKEILQTLQEVNKPLTLTLLMMQMAKRGFYWRKDTLTAHLAQLVEDGTVENPPDARPRGYRLPEGEE